MPREVHSAAELINDVGVDIEGVSFYKLSAKLREQPEGEAVTEPPTEVEPSYRLRIRQHGRELGIRLVTTLDLTVGKIVVDAAVHYVTKDDVQLAEDVKLEFANEVGIMALLPYVRQAVADLSQRVIGEIVLMPVLKRGELTFSRDMREA